MRTERLFEKAIDLARLRARRMMCIVGLTCEMRYDRANTLQLLVFVALCFGFLLATPTTLATDWPQFRGPNRDGIGMRRESLNHFPGRA